MNDSRPQLWKAWLPAFIWLGVIALESTDLGAAENTGHLLYPLFHFLFGVDPFRFETWHHYIRKTGHVVGYGLLSWFFFRAWQATLPILNPRRWSLRWAAVAFFSTALVASLDEWHQTYLPARTGRWQDAVLDSCAALTVQLFLWLVLLRRQQTT